VINQRAVEFKQLVIEGEDIIRRLQETLSRPDILSIIQMGSPFFFDKEDSHTIKTAIGQIKATSGLGPLRSLFGEYIDWSVMCESIFTKYRCQSDSRAKDFKRFGVKAEKFAEGKLTPDAFLLNVRKQVGQVKSLANHIPTKRKKPSKKTENKHEHENILIDFITRKAIQGIAIGMVVLLATFLITDNWNISSLSLLGVLMGFFIGILLQIIYVVYSIQKTNLGRFGGFLLLAGYAMIFLAISAIYTPDLHTHLGDIVADISLLALLVITELLTRWGTLRFYEKIMDYLYSSIWLVIVVVSSYAVSVLVEQPFWIGFTIVGFILTVWERVKPS
jgi:hypothetical protein